MLIAMILQDRRLGRSATGLGHAHGWLAGLLGCLLAWHAVPLSADPLLRATLAGFGDERTLVLAGAPLLSGRQLAVFYADRDNQLAWGEAAPIRALLALVEQSPAHGFDPQDFHPELLRRYATPGALEALSGVERLTADLLLSDALLRYVHHRRFGKLDPMAVDRKWNDRPPVPSERLTADMRAALAGSDLSAAMEERFPAPFWYEQLRGTLARSVDRARLARLPPLPGGVKLAVGSRGSSVLMLRERLAILDGQPTAPSAEPERFDTELHEAVIAFQRRSGLLSDGVVGPATLAALNGQGDTSNDERIRINLERMRWLYDDLPPDYLFVDIAGFRVRIARGGEFVWSTRAIVGTAETQTPMFRDTMDHLVFNPTWTVPPSIQKKMRGVSGDYRIVDRRTGQRVSGGNISDHRRYRIIQEPGPRNALGRVKFMFPNHHAIYLHDTPSRGLFERQTRALSNGCVRVQNPLKLAEVILDQPTWNRSGIERVIEGGRTRYVNLAETLPVLLYYLTAYADAEGRVGFRQDIYGRDEALLKAFAAPVTRARIDFPETPELPWLMASDPTEDDATTPESGASALDRDEASEDEAPAPRLDAPPASVTSA